MAKIQIKRGLQAAVTSLVLDVGELALATDTGKVYVGATAGTVLVNPEGGTADQASKLSTARNFSLTGDAVAPAVAFDGTGNVELNVTIASVPKDKITGLGSAAGLDTGTLAGNVVALGADGKIPEALLPAVSVMDVFEAENEAAMLALSAQQGDICVRTDEGKSYILSKTPATAAANWVWLKTPDCKVLSVNGQTGAVSLTAAQVGAAPDTHLVQKATSSSLGHVAAGTGLAVDAEGVLSVASIDGGAF